MNDRLMIAAMAMQGLCADNTIVGRAGKTFAEVVSSMALECADALLAAAGEKGVGKAQVEYEAAIIQRAEAENG